MHQGSVRLSRQLQAIKKTGVVLLGISADTAASQKKFQDKFSLPFPLLADPEKKIANLFGVVKEKNMYGKKVKGIARTTFVIGPDGKIKHIFNNVKAEGHADEVLAYLKARPEDARFGGRLHRVGTERPRRPVTSSEGSEPRSSAAVVPQRSIRCTHDECARPRHFAESRVLQSRSRGGSAGAAGEIARPENARAEFLPGEL